MKIIEKKESEEKRIKWIFILRETKLVRKN